MQCEFGNLNDLHEFFDQELSWTIGKHAVFDQRRSFGWIQRFGSCRSLPPKEVQPNCVLTKSCRWAADLSNFVHVIPWGFVTEASNNNQRCRHSFSCFLFARHKAQCCNLPWHDQDDLDVGNLHKFLTWRGDLTSKVKLLQIHSGVQHQNWSDHSPGTCKWLERPFSFFLLPLRLAWTAFEK